MVGGEERKTARTGEPFGLKPGSTVPAVGVAGGGVFVGSSSPGVTGGGVSVASSAGKVGGGGVSEGVAAKMAVCVRFGVGKVKGVGEDAPGSVHAPAMNPSMTIVRTSDRFCIRPRLTREISRLTRILHHI